MRLEGEFALLEENAEEFGLALQTDLTVRRVEADVDGNRVMSAIAWGAAPPGIVLVHGGGQNAHTWDTVALALERPIVAPDLPGHGHSGPAGDDPNIIAGYAKDLASALAAFAPNAQTLVGMSVGGLACISLVSQHPGRFDRLVLVDILPGPDPRAAANVRNFLAGPDSYATLGEMVERAISFNPGRSPSSLRRGVLHNALQGNDGRWRWRHRHSRRALSELSEADANAIYDELWDGLARSDTELMLVRGMAAGSVVTDDHERRLKNLRPDVSVIRLAGAGHSVQGDRPIELAAAIASFADRR